MYKLNDLVEGLDGKRFGIMSWHTDRGKDCVHHDQVVSTYYNKFYQ